MKLKKVFNSHQTEDPGDPDSVTEIGCITLQTFDVEHLQLQNSVKHQN